MFSASESDLFQIHGRNRSGESDVIGRKIESIAILYHLIRIDQKNSRMTMTDTGLRAVQEKAHVF